MNLFTLGDPHLGRIFTHGVPLHRRGEREAMVWQDFRSCLHLSEPVDLHVCMGDLFDRSYVPYDLILDVAVEYRVAAMDHKTTKFVILKGNHDWTRDLDKASAFDVLEVLLEDLPNVSVVSESLLLPDFDCAFFAWQPVTPAAEMIKTSFKTAFGHWDTDQRLADIPNYIPTEALKAAGCETAYTGHVHSATTFKRNGLEVVQTGSMQPMAHGEVGQLRKDLYVNRRIDDLDDVQNRCVCVDLKPGEMIHEIPDCLQFKTRALVVEEDEDPGEVEVGDFDLMKLFDEVMVDVDDDVKKVLREKMSGS